MAPFLTIYTPTYKRPKMLERCMESVRVQVGVMGLDHLVVADATGVGIAGMFAEIGRHCAKMAGRYVYVLQDDDYLAGETVVERLAEFARAEHEPAVIMVRNVKNGQMLPSYWMERPRFGHVDLGSYVTRRDVFVDNAKAFGKRYEGDFDFIDALWNQGYRFEWLDLLMAREQVGTAGRGRPEEEILRWAN